MLSYRDVASMLGHAKYTTMWEQWQIAKGFIEATREESARDFYTRRMTPVFVEALQERYDCRLGPLEVRVAHDQVNIQACAIHERGNLPTGEATHLFVKQISNEGWTQQYGQTSEPFLVQDAIRGSLLRTAFKAHQVAMFLIIGNGDRESFVVLPNSNEVDDAVVSVIETFRNFVETDVEPPPDYVMDRKALLAMAAATDRNLPAYPGDKDPEFVAKVARYQEVKSKKSALNKEARELDKEQEYLSGYIATKLRDHARAHVGSTVITVRTVTRNMPAQVQQFSQIDMKG